MHGTLLTGAAMILQRGFDPEAVLGDGDATMFFGVPTMYARLADAPGLERLGSLRLCVSGSAPLSAELHERIRAGSGQVVLERYGMTETVMLASNPYEGERKPGSVGLPLPGVDIRLDPASSEILVQGPNVFSGYLDQPEATAGSFTDDGWFRTGDVGSFDDDGYLSIVGRAKELIISGGYNVYPREIEDVLRTHPAVIDAAVVGTPDDEWGEIVTAYVEADRRPRRRRAHRVRGRAARAVQEAPHRAPRRRAAPQPHGQGPARPAHPPHLIRSGLQSRRCAFDRDQFGRSWPSGGDGRSQRGGVAHLDDGAEVLERALGCLRLGHPRRDVRQSRRGRDIAAGLLVDDPARGLTQRRLHVVAATLGRPQREREHRPERREVAGRVVARRRRHEPRRAVAALDVGDAAHRLGELLPSRPLTPRADVAVAVDRHVDDARSHRRDVARRRSRACRARRRGSPA